MSKTSLCFFLLLPVFNLSGGLNRSAICTHERIISPVCYDCSDKSLCIFYFFFRTFNCFQINAEFSENLCFSVKIKLLEQFHETRRESNRCCWLAFDVVYFFLLSLRSKVSLWVFFVEFFFWWSFLSAELNLVVFAFFPQHEYPFGNLTAGVFCFVCLGPKRQVFFTQSFGIPSPVPNFQKARLFFVLENGRRKIKNKFTESLSRSRTSLFLCLLHSSKEKLKTTQSWV